MIVTPLVRGLLGLEAVNGGREWRFMPQLPAHWERVAVKRFRVGDARYDLTLRRARGRMTIYVAPSEHQGSASADFAPTREAETAAGQLARKLIIGPAFPLDARVRAVRVGGRVV